MGFYFSTLPGGFFNAEAVVTFLRHLRGKVLVLWDGGGNRKRPVIRAFLARNRRLTLERLAPYAPHLNPVEFVWSWLKYGQRANYVPDGVDKLKDQIVERLIALKCDTGLLRKLWDGSDLPFP